MYDTSLEVALGVDYKTLKVLIIRPDHYWTLSEVTEAMNKPKMSVYRSLERVVKSGLISYHTDDYRKYYQVKQTYLLRHLRTLRNLDSDVIYHVMDKFADDCSLMILFGSRATGTDDLNSDWDLVLVSQSLDELSINPEVSEMEERFDCQINVKLYTAEGFQSLSKGSNPFFEQLLRNGYVLKGDIYELG